MSSLNRLLDACLRLRWCWWSHTPQTAIDVWEVQNKAEYQSSDDSSQEWDEVQKSDKSSVCATKIPPKPHISARQPCMKPEKQDNGHRAWQTDHRTRERERGCTSPCM
jgi:hypothetical protein